MPSFASIDALRSAQGSDLGYGDWLAISRDRIGRFKNAIAYPESMQGDPDNAASHTSGEPLAPELFTLSLISRLCTGLVDLREKRVAVNYGLNRVRFRGRLAAGARVRARARLESVTRIDGGVQIVLDVAVERERGAEPICIAQIVRRYYL
jgi:acyl dehydratase